MLKMIKKIFLPVLLILVIAFALNGCFGTATTQPAPALSKRSGTAPTAAMLPILHTNDPAIAKFISQELVACLSDRNAFQFAPAEKVAAAVKEINVNLTGIMGPGNAEHQKLAEKLGVVYTLYGVVTVRKDLKLTGWRKDVDIFIRLHDATGKKVDSWRSMTDFTWTKASTELDAQKMAQSAANHTCSKMIEQQY